MVGRIENLPRPWIVQNAPKMVLAILVEECPKGELSQIESLEQKHNLKVCPSLDPYHRFAVVESIKSQPRPWIVQNVPKMALAIFAEKCPKGECPKWNVLDKNTIQKLKSNMLGSFGLPFGFPMSPVWFFVVFLWLPLVPLFTVQILSGSCWPPLGS